jgi:putative MATE family efflux protein
MANRTLRQALAIAVVIGLIGTALLLIFAEPALDLMGAEPQARAEGVTYLRLVSLVFVLQSVLFVSNACLRGAGDTRTAMVVMGVVNVLNIVVSWTAINGPFGLPRLGVAGSALGAVVGRGAGGLLVLVMLIRGRNGLKLVPRDWRPDMETVKRMLRVGLPTGVERLVIRFAMMIFLRAVAGLGTVAVAAHAVALRAESLSFMPGFGFAMAGTTLVGQGLGARQPKRAERSGYMTHRMATALMSVMGLMFILFPRFFVSLFTDDVAVIEMAITPLRIVGFVQPFLASSMVFPGSLRGAGDTMFPMYVSSASIWATRVPLTLLFAYALNLGLPGAWIAMGLDQAVRGTIFFLRFRSGQWKLKQV